ncbi:DUF3153 domain-containing protein [Nocardia donostiensis]|uniref:DUF3153 domain-containing protein n=1 Tax=Nocardia donostiensis TaxID=1538463 RepID=A0A1W0AQ59_9NOCA|nr:DUF3153 domain-containing protein [Nocardia donostiensis]OQS12388.1 DUF3153 domain-containing protein [Nocardia donostiensis]OQS18499.1 DUF3153 domain-containing protein [Nocardia donostiensis]
MQPSPSPAVPDAPVLSPRPPGARNSLRARVTAVFLLAALLVPALTGCLRVQTSMGVSSNDRVSGRIVAAVVPENSEDKGPQLEVPESLATKVRVEPYDQDGYVGSEVYFDDLSFGEVQQLEQLSEETSGMFQLQFRRNGDLVSLDGRIDLESVPPHGSDVQLSVAFPARVAKTNGTREGESIVSWKLPSGEVSTVRAEVGYADPNTRSFGGWAGIVGGVTLAVAAIIAALAYLDRNPAAPGAPQGFSLRRWWEHVRNE